MRKKKTEPQTEEKVKLHKIPTFVVDENTRKEDILAHLQELGYTKEAMLSFVRAETGWAQKGSFERNFWQSLVEILKGN
jgi:hypothetical protein